MLALDLLGLQVPKVLVDFAVCELILVCELLDQTLVDPESSRLCEDALELLERFWVMNSQDVAALYARLLGLLLLRPGFDHTIPDMGHLEDFVLLVFLGREWIILHGKSLAALLL